MDKPLTTCAFTGHRPANYSFKCDENDLRCKELKKIMTDCVESLITRGVNRFLSGVALGADIWAAEIINEMKKKHTDISLIAVRPCETQANRWPKDDKIRYFEILQLCDEVKTLKTNYTRSCMFERNRYLVDNAQYLIAIYDGSKKGGTAYTVKYGVKKKIEMTLIHPGTLSVTSFSS
jgi:uncharacterized phage-like protein YoqJ